MKNRLLPAAVVALAVGLAYLASVKVLRPEPPAAPETPPTPAGRPAPPAAPAPLSAVVDVLDIDPLLDPPADPESGSAPAGPVVTAFGGEPVPQPVRPAGGVVPIPPAEDDTPPVEVAPMPREVNADTSWMEKGTPSRARALNAVYDGQELGWWYWADDHEPLTAVLLGGPSLDRICPVDDDSAYARFAFPNPFASLSPWCRRNWYGEERLPQQARHDWDPHRGMFDISLSWIGPL